MLGEEDVPGVCGLGGRSRITYRNHQETFTVFDEEGIRFSRNTGIVVVFFSDVCGRSGKSWRVASPGLHVEGTEGDPGQGP